MGVSAHSRRAKHRKSSERNGRLQVKFEKKIGMLFLKYARMVVARGYIHNSLGNMAIRVCHPAFEDGIVYTKHAEVSLEEMTLDNVVITDIETGKLLCGRIPPSVGHQLNREILRLRPDINAVLHVHHDETLSLLASGAVKEIKVVSLEFPYVMAKPPHIVPSHINVEEDVSPIKEFIQHTNSIVMENHGVTTLGQTISEAYHRLNTLTSEVRRNVLAEMLASMKATEIHYLGQEAVDWMYGRAEQVIYPSRFSAKG